MYNLQFANGKYVSKFPYLTNPREHRSYSLFDSKLQLCCRSNSPRIGDSKNREDTWHSGRTHNSAHNRRVLVDHPIATAALRCASAGSVAAVRVRGREATAKERDGRMRKKRRARRRCYRDGRTSRCFTNRPRSELTATILCISRMYRRTLNATRDATLTEITLVTLGLWVEER